MHQTVTQPFVTISSILKARHLTTILYFISDNLYLINFRALCSLIKSEAIGITPRFGKWEKNRSKKQFFNCERHQVGIIFLLFVFDGISNE